MENRNQYSVVKGPRILFINFDEYTEGDVEFKKELIGITIKSLREFQESLHTAITGGDLALFAKACHKSKVVLNMLNDQELLVVIHEIERHISNSAGAANSSLLLESFDGICDAVAASLELEQKAS